MNMISIQLVLQDNNRKNNVKHSSPFSVQCPHATLTAHHGNLSSSPAERNFCSLLLTPFKRNLSPFNGSNKFFRASDHEAHVNMQLLTENSFCQSSHLLATSATAHTQQTV